METKTNKKPNRERIVINITLSKSTIAGLKQHKQNTGVPHSQIIERLLNQYFEHQTNKQ